MNAVRALALVTLVAIVTGCNHGASARRTRPVPSPNPVPTVAAKRTTVQASTSISGVIAPLQNVALSSSLSEPVNKVNVSEGDRVRTGQVLAVLDTADLRAQLAQAVATVQSDERSAASSQSKVAQARYTQQLTIGQSGDQTQSTRAALAAAQQTLRNDSLNLQRDRGLVASGYIAQQTVDAQQTTVNNDASAVRTAQANLQSAITNQTVTGTSSSGLQAADVSAAQADANAARATIGEAQAQVAQYRAQIAKATIVSPIDGVIVNRNLNPGEYPGARTIFTIQQLDRVYAVLNASSADTFAIPVGAHVRLAVAGNATSAYSGNVVAVLGQVTPGTTDFTVKVLVANADGRLQSGLPVTATASLPPVTGVGIPTTAFLDDTHTSVMVASDELVDVVAKTVRVRELGANATTSIVSGISVGQSVIANGQLGLSDGQSLAQN